MRASVNPRPLGGGGSSISVESPPCVQGSRRKTTKKRKTKQTLLILAALDVVGNIWEDLGKSSSHCMGRSSLLVKWFSPIFPPKPAGFGQSQHRGGCVPGTDSLLCICLAEHDLCFSMTSVCYLLLSSESGSRFSPHFPRQPVLLQGLQALILEIRSFLLFLLFPFSFSGLRSGGVRLSAHSSGIASLTLQFPDGPYLKFSPPCVKLTLGYGSSHISVSLHPELKLEHWDRWSAGLWDAGSALQCSSLGSLCGWDAPSWGSVYGRDAPG